MREIEWVAGLIEGEGNFAFDRRPLIQVAMTDKDVLEKVCQILGARSVSGPYAPRRKGYKPMFHTGLYGNHAAGWMMTLYSLMGGRRKQQIRSVLAEWRGRKSRPGLVRNIWAAV